MYEFYGFEWNAGAPRATGCRKWNPAAKMHLDSGQGYVGTSASGVGLFFGLNRGFELNDNAFGPIQHVNSIALVPFAGGQLDNRWVWPASNKDGLCNGTTTCLWAIPYGQLFALPLSVDIDTLTAPGGAPFTTLQKRIAVQVRDYGMYAYEGTNSGNNSRGDQHISPSARTAFIAAMKTLKPLMRPILNNEGPTTQPTWTCAGGGIPIAANSAFDA
jgi:hypothetical protein